MNTTLFFVDRIFHIYSISVIFNTINSHILNSDWYIGWIHNQVVARRGNNLQCNSWSYGMAVTLTDSFQNLLQRCMYCCVDIVSLCACALIYSCIVRSRQKIAVLREGMQFKIVNAAPLPCVTIIRYPPKLYFISCDLIRYISIIDISYV